MKRKNKPRKQEKKRIGWSRRIDAPPEDIAASLFPSNEKKDVKDGQA